MNSRGVWLVSLTCLAVLPLALTAAVLIGAYYGLSSFMSRIDLICVLVLLFISSITVLELFGCLLIYLTLRKIQSPAVYTLSCSSQSANAT